MAQRVLDTVSRPLWNDFQLDSHAVMGGNAGLCSVLKPHHRFGALSMSSGADLDSAQPTLAGGVIEIAALTTLLGAPTAESLVLGSRGASGILWASMSIFGIYAVIRGSVAAATPNWLRETLGVRSAALEQSVGSAFELSSRNIHTRLKLGPAIGIQSEMRKDKTCRSENEFMVQSRCVIYAFNRLTSKFVSSVRAGVDGTGGFYIYIADPYRKDWMKFAAWADFYGVLFSTLKLLEVFVLYKLGAYWLAWLAGGSWAIFLLCAICLIVLGLSRKDDRRDAQTDMLVGQLPTPTAVGGERVVVLGTPSYTRQSVAWVVTWILGAITSMASLVLYYVVLGKLEPTVFYTWTGFQLAWLVGRMAFFHYSGKHGDLEFALVRRDWKKLSPSCKTRIRSLAYGLSTHLMNVHPRKQYSYEEDATEIPDLGTVAEEYPYAVDGPEGEAMVCVTSVIGDTMLASACWVGGATSHLTGSTLYDSCIVQCRVGEKIFSVPAARVLSCVRPSVPVDEEAAPEPLFPARGGANTGPNNAIWVYWIPYGLGLWLQLKSKYGRILGERPATLMTDEQITAVMQSGELFVSLREVDEVKEIVKTSKEACQAVMGFVS